MSFVTESYPHKISNLFIDALNFCGFNQMVDSPTRNDNVFDLFATNKSSRWDIILWNKVDYQRIEQKITKFSETFHADFSIDTPVQHLRDAFKSLCHRCLSLIPHKTVSKSCKLPWIARYVKHLSNKKQHVYNRACLSGSDVDSEEYR